MSEDQNNDEIDLADLFASLWAYKVMIAAITASALSISVIYALSAPEQFTSSSVFARKSGQSGPRIPSQYSEIAALAGLGGMGSDNSSLFERIAGRDFVVRLANELDLVNDPYFYSPEDETSGFTFKSLKSRSLDAIRGLTGAGSGGIPNFDAPPDPLDRVVEVFAENVQAAETKNGSTEVTVTHTNAVQAARIANGVVSLLIEEVEAEEEAEQRQQLSYLSGELAAALAEAEQTKRKVAEFALQNSLTSEGAFAQRSEAMFRLRDELDKTLRMQSTVNALLGALEQTETPDRETFEVLRMVHPTVDDVDFRRLLGLPEALGAWAWPSITRLKDFAATLRDREVRTKRSLDELNLEAMDYARATERLAGLEREAQVAEATYSVLIEQVKAQSLAYGYQGKAFQIYQSAVPNLKPSAPRKSLIVALGGVLGLFLGAALALLRAMGTDVLRTRRAVTDATGARLTCTVPHLKAVTTNFERSMRRLNELQSSDLLELSVAVQEEPNRDIIISATGGRTRALPAGLYLAASISKADGNSDSGAGDETAAPLANATLFILGERAPKLPESSEMGAGRLERTLSGSIEIITPRVAQDLGVIISGGLLLEEVRRVRANDRRAIVATSEPYAAAVLRALREERPMVMTISRPGSSLRASIHRMRQILQIDINLFVGRR